MLRAAAMENNLWWTFATTHVQTDFVSVQIQPLEGSVSQENLRGEAENQVFIFSQKGLSFSGGISSSKVDMFELSVFLHTSSIYIKTAGTTVWHQSKIQWQNDPSCVLRFLGGKLQRPGISWCALFWACSSSTSTNNTILYYIILYFEAVATKKGPNTRLHSWRNDCSSSSFVFYVALNNKPKRHIKKFLTGM